MSTQDDTKKLEPIKTGYAQKLHPMPSQIWRPELTEKQKQEQQKQIDAGEIPF